MGAIWDIGKLILKFLKPEDKGKLRGEPEKFPYRLLGTAELENYLLEKSKLTVINNDFVPREIHNVKDYDKNAGFEGLLIIGFASTGKTRYATELIKNYYAAKTEPTVILVPTSNYPVFDFDFRNVPAGLENSTVILFIDDLPKYFLDPPGAEKKIAFYESPTLRLRNVIESLRVKAGKLIVIATTRKEILPEDIIKEDILWEHFGIQEIKNLSKKGIEAFIKSLTNYYNLEITYPAKRYLVGKSRGDNLEAFVYYFEKIIKKRGIKKINKKDVLEFEEEVYSIWKRDTLEPLIEKNHYVKYIYEALSTCYSYDITPSERAIKTISLIIIKKYKGTLAKRDIRNIRWTLDYLISEDYIKKVFIRPIRVRHDKLIKKGLHTVSVPDYQVIAAPKLTRFELLDGVFEFSRLIPKEERQIFYSISACFFRDEIGEIPAVSAKRFLRRLSLFGIANGYFEYFRKEYFDKKISKIKKLKLARKAYRKYPRDIYAACWYATHLAKMDRTVEGVKAITKAIKKQKDPLSVAFGLAIAGVCFQGDGLHEYALVVFRRALQIIPNLGFILIDKAESEIELKRFDEAKETLASLVRSDDALPDEKSRAKLLLKKVERSV